MPTGEVVIFLVLIVLGVGWTQEGKVVTQGVSGRDNATRMLTHSLTHLEAEAGFYLEPPATRHASSPFLWPGLPHIMVARYQ